MTIGLNMHREQLDTIFDQKNNIIIKKSKPWFQSRSGLFYQQKKHFGRI